MKKIAPLSLLLLAVNMSHGATVIANFNTASSSGLTNSVTTSGYTITDITGNDLNLTTLGGIGSSTGNITYLTVRANGTESTTAGYSKDYLAFTITGTTPIQLAEISFDLAFRTSTTNPLSASLGLWASVDGGSFQQITFSSLTPTTPTNPEVTADISTGSFTYSPASGTDAKSYAGTVGIDLSSLTPATSIEFRLGFGDNQSSQYIGTLIQNVQVTAVPEPSTYAFGAVGILGALMLIRQRRK